MTKLIIGCGYLGRRVARLWLDAGFSVVAVTRSPIRAEELNRQGLQSIVADITKPETLVSLPGAETALFAVGYDASSGLSRQAYYVDGLQAVIAALSSKIRRFILISTTSVYGQTAGQWIDENSPCSPKTETGLAFLEAENVLDTSQFGHNAVILRLAGLYGPGRLLRRSEDLLAGKPLNVKKNNYLNLIHVDDAAAVVVAAETLVKPPCKYIVSDGNPVTYHDYLAYLAKLLDAPAPKFIEPVSENTNSNRGATNKRLKNTKMLSELGVVLKCPTYKVGLDAIFSS
jgi:nucleoside-diphosphate-sugar epimerase